MNTEQKKKKVVCIIGTILLFLLSCWNEQFVFVVEERNERLLGWLLIKILFAGIVYSILWKLLHLKTEEVKRSILSPNLVCAVIAFVGLLALWKVLGTYPFAGDESAIYNAAIIYDFGKRFTVYTGFFHGLCLMLNPHMWSIVVIKMLLLVAVVFYCIERLKSIYTTKLIYGLWLILFLPSVWDIDISVHRLPIYICFYILFLVKMYCDAMEKKGTKKNIIILALLGALLSQWRVEGIYMLVLLPIMLVIAFKIEKKKILQVVLLCLICQVAVYVPNKTLTESGGFHQQLLPFYASTLTNMIRGGLDQEKNQELLLQIGEYVDMEVIENVNREMGDAAFGDVYVMWYGAWDESNSAEEFGSLMIQLILRNIPDYVKTQIKLVNYISLQYANRLSDTGRGIIFKVYDLVMAVFNYSWIPVGILLVALITCMKKRKWLLFWMIAGGLCAAGITTVLTPAAYFKYYIVPYMMGYGILYIWLVEMLKKRNIE